MLNQFLFETMDFGEFEISDFREYIINKSSPDIHLKKANELFSKGVEIYKNIEEILPDKGKLTNIAKLTIAGKLSYIALPYMVEQEYNKYMMKKLDLNVYYQVFPFQRPKTGGSFGGGGAKGGH